MATFFNQATLTYNNSTILSNITAGEIQEVLSITKNAVQNTYTQGDDITYVINIRNTGTTDYNNLTITDNLGAYTAGSMTLVPLTQAEDAVAYFIDGVLQAAPIITTSPALTISGIRVPAGGTATVIYTARLNQYAPLNAGSSITNIAAVSGAGIGPITASEIITAAESANLSIVKSLSPTVVTEDAQITYTFVIQNTGNTAVVATDNAIITDTFDPILSNLMVSYNGVSWTAPANYSYNPVTGLFSTNPGQITVPAATFSQDPATGAIVIQPGISTLTITGNI